MFLSKAGLSESDYCDAVSGFFYEEQERFVPGKIKNDKKLKELSSCVSLRRSMKLLLFISVLLYPFAILTDPDEDDFSPPVWPRYKPFTNDIDRPIKIPLGKHEDSGCLCREVPSKWTVCFGRDSCRRFPRIIKIRTTLLRIKTTQIGVLHREDLSGVTHLDSLEIEANYYLNKIEGGTFRDMANLTNMSISYNANLMKLEVDTFEGLVNLKELFLIKNGFTKITDVSLAMSSRVLPNIYKLALSENTFREINQEDFSPMVGSSLSELNLVLCQTEYIDPESFAPLTHLSTIRLGENRFNTSTVSDLIKNSIELGIPLKVVNLYAVGFRKAPPKSLLKAISNSNITHLGMARNQFEIIKENTFPPMPDLEYLDLREVLALNITLNAFSGMPKLHTLLLNGNKLPSVPDGVLLEQLTYLDLSANSGNSFYPSYFSLGKNKFVKMRKLKYLNLSYNRINTLFNATFNGLSGLRVLGLRNATIYHIEEGAFSPLEDLLVLNLENNQFAKINSLSAELFVGLHNLEVLLLSGCLISKIPRDSNPFRYLDSLTHLGLEDNRLLMLPADVLRPLRNLVSIDISRNFLPPWQEVLFAENKNLSVVLASHNKFSYFSKAMLEDFSKLTRLDVSGNPYACECSTFLSLSQWVHKSQNRTILELIAKNPGFCVYPDQAGDETILEFYESLQNGSRTCGLFYDPQLTLLYALPLITLAIIALALGALGYMYRWHIRYWMFLARLNIRRIGKGRSKKRKLRSYTNYEYDAFVSYSNDDRNYVIRLVAMLENFEPFLKLCVYERDFQIGTVISETVLESVAKSRKTVLIISDSYARSQWCRWEVQIAEHHRLFFEDDNGEYVDDSLVMIRLGDISDAHMTPTLKYLMKTRIYLQWDSEPKKQKAFWDKLRRTLAPPKIIFDSSV